MLTQLKRQVPQDFRPPLVAAVAAIACGFVSVLHGPITARLGAIPGSAVEQWISRGFGTLAWLAIASCASGLTDAILWRRVVAAAIKRPVPAILRTLASACIYLTAMLCVVAFVFNSSVGAFVTALGAGGVVLGLALRAIFEDLFTGIAINLDHALGIGDWISVQSAGRRLTGQVKEIGWRCTHLETEDGQLLVVPNGTLGREVVTNISRPVEATRYQSEILLDPDVPVERGRRILLGAIRSLLHVEGFVANRSPAVLVGEPTEDGVPYLLRYWILPWNPLSPTTAQDRVLSRALDHLALANVPVARERQEVLFSRFKPRVSHEVSIVERATLLGRVKLFDGLADDERQQLAADLRRVACEAGEILFRQNEPGETLFVIAEGAVDVLAASADSANMVRVATLGSGEFLGEMSLLTGDPRRATVRAATACVLYELSRETIAGLVEARPELTEILSLALAERRAALDSAGKSAPDATEVDRGRKTILQKMLQLFGSAVHR